MSQESTKKPGIGVSREVAIGGLVGAAAYFLLIEHREHLFVWLPYLILLACPLMHIFMHSGHKHGGTKVPPDELNDDYKRGYADGISKREVSIREGDNHE